MSSPRSLTIGTAGHVDHGKTALVEALTGTNTDRLAEERRRGLSIELGFAQLEFAQGPSLSVVDVPGHERFIRAMVAGASGIDAFLVVIAADDGVMAQTREHLIVLRALGVGRGVVAISKCDLADAEARARAAREAGALLPEAEVVEVSARTGQGLEELRAAIAAMAATVEPRPAAATAEGWPSPALMHLDRVFTLHGTGTVVTGTLGSGEIRRGQRVELLPSGERARVRALQVHDREVDSALAGTRLACNLAGLGRAGLDRGDAIASIGSGMRPGFRLDVELELVNGASLDDGERVQVHHGTRSSLARVVLLGERFAQLRLQASLLARAGDRCVIRKPSPPGTAGGAVVIDPAPPRHRGDGAAERLRLISKGSPEELLSAALADSPEIGADPVEWREVPLLGPALRRFSPERWREALRAGAPPPPSAPAPPKEPHPAPLKPVALRVQEVLRAEGIDAPAPQDLAAELGVSRAAALEALEALASRGEAVMVKPDLYLEPAGLERAGARVIEVIGERGSITLGEARDALATSRRRAEAVLNHLDASGATIRRGEARVMRSSHPGRQGSGGPAGPQNR